VSALLLHDLIDSAARRFGNAVAVTHGATRLTYAGIAGRSREIAAALSERGVRRGDRVCVAVRARAEAVPVWLAIARLGAVFVPCNPAAPERDKARIIERIAPVLIAGDEPFAHLSFDQLAALSAAPGDRDDCTDEDQTHVIFFTSGTTGAPKGVEISHRTDYLRAVSRIAGEPRGPYVCMFPQFHMAGWAQPLSSLASGEGVVYADGGDTAALARTVHEHRAGRIYLIPAVLQRMVSYAGRPAGAYDSVRKLETGTSATSPELLERAAAAFPNAELSVAYGSTEASCVCLLTAGDIRSHPGSVGRAFAGTQVQLSDAGEIQVKSPFLFSRYFRDPEATGRAFAGGWFRTGESGVRDADGFYTITGRTDDLIRSGGEWVAPAAVDLIVHKHPAVADAAVAGLPDPDWGQVVTAFVVLRDGTGLTLQELRAHCEGHVSRSSLPRRLEFVDHIPRSPATGQPLRRQLGQALGPGDSGHRFTASDGGVRC
jgi:acyl-CoA synthetase (AMP-forming)/AMP-acid ligase II